MISEAAAIKVELDVEEVSEKIGERVAERLAEMFPSEAAEFWAALCEQAYRERKRIAAMLDLVCCHPEKCPRRIDLLGGVRFGADPDTLLAQLESRTPAPSGQAGVTRAPQRP